MSGKLKAILLACIALIVGLVAFFYLKSINIPVLNPEGPIGQKERGLIILAAALSLIVVIPVYFMLFFFAWKYRASNKNVKYQPNFDHSRLIESIWWGVPLIIIAILAVATWKSSNELDPFKSITSNNKTIKIQVVALQWKWLFIYPEQNIATVNMIEFPKNTPIDFEITADAPMNSFWIPQLGGQIYAMSGMSTHLHLVGDKEGEYEGLSANISGEGFSGMKFTAKVTTDDGFNKWVGYARTFNNALDTESYNRLSMASKDNPVGYYSSASKGLYDLVLIKFMNPTYGLTHTGLL